MKGIQALNQNLNQPYNITNIRVALQKNLHIPETATYYLLLKKYVKEGNFTKCDICSEEFDPMLLEPETFHFKDV